MGCVESKGAIEPSFTSAKALSTTQDKAYHTKAKHVQQAWANMETIDAKCSDVPQWSDPVPIFEGRRDGNDTDTVDTVFTGDIPDMSDDEEQHDESDYPLDADKDKAFTSAALLPVIAVMAVFLGIFSTN